MSNKIPIYIGIHLGTKESLISFYNLITQEPIIIYNNNIKYPHFKSSIEFEKNQLGEWKAKESTWTSPIQFYNSKKLMTFL